MEDVVAAVGASSLFRRLAAAHPAVEARADGGPAGDGWSYAWIVSRRGERAVRNLAYVRLRGGRLQRRTYDRSGDDLWEAAE